MSAVPADLSIASRWILPMTSPQAMLENHTLVVREGRILDLLPSPLAAERYAAAAHLDRSEHLLLPGLVNAHTRIAAAAGAAGRRRLHAARSSIAEMLRAGTTCFCGMDYSPAESALAAADQGLRTVVGIPIAETASPWAATAAEYLTRALRFRDEYRGHPRITTAFAVHAPSAVGDATFARVATLADELDSVILMALHQSRAEIEESVARHGVRPIERMHALGLLTPALAAVHMVHVEAADLALARRGGIAVILCPESNLQSEGTAAPASSWTAAGLRLGLGTGADDHGTALDLWSQLRLLALLSRLSGVESALSGWDALAAATRGGASALGLESDIGTLETGKCADLCCIDLRHPAMHRAALDPSRDPVSRLVFNGSRDMVSDVWVSGSHLLDGGAFTRPDLAELAARTPPARQTTGDRE